ncbi:histidine phosphatase family protein [Streptomyces aurantiogriseus]|uniref:histidine phosphatase family protein n=1 Tax=Streptomyces aurantiogriseus TaxID=66870 RepID=UPI001E2F311F|nr:histidine phosphatase family protein [Streptomyces aurantiogriseus]
MVFDDGALSKSGLGEAGTTVTALPRYSAAFRGPSARCAQTAQVLGLKAALEPALRDFDYGEWRGRTAAEVAATDPYRFSAWLTDPDATPHGGESVRQLCQRFTNWLSSLPSQTDHILAVTEPAVIRAALVHALSAPVRAFWHLEVPPLVMVSLAPRCRSLEPGPSTWESAVSNAQDLWISPGRDAEGAPSRMIS